MLSKRRIIQPLAATTPSKAPPLNQKERSAMAGLSPTQRTRGALRDLGRNFGTVERWIPRPGLPGGGFRSDLFGFIDLIVLCPERGIVAIQSCGQDFSGHYRKITEQCAEMAIEWLECGGKIELWGWRRLKEKRGGKRYRWRPRIHDFKIEDFETAEDPCRETA